MTSFPASGELFVGLSCKEYVGSLGHCIKGFGVFSIVWFSCLTHMLSGASTEL